MLTLEQFQRLQRQRREQLKKQWEERQRQALEELERYRSAIQSGKGEDEG